MRRNKLQEIEKRNVSRNAVCMKVPNTELN